MKEGPFVSAHQRVPERKEGLSDLCLGSHRENFEGPQRRLLFRAVRPAEAVAGQRRRRQLRRGRRRRPPLRRHRVSLQRLAGIDRDSEEVSSRIFELFGAECRKYDKKKPGASLFLHHSSI